MNLGKKRSLASMTSGCEARVPPFWCQVKGSKNIPQYMHSFALSLFAGTLSVMCLLASRTNGETKLCSRPGQLYNVGRSPAEVVSAKNADNKKRCQLKELRELQGTSSHCRHCQHQNHLS